MEEQIQAALLASSGVTALVAGRVSFGAHPQGQPLPAAVLNTISDISDHTLQGPDGVPEARVQIDCYAMTYGEAKQLSRAVRAVLDGFSAGAIQGVFLAGARDMREGGTNEATRPFRVSLDFMVRYSMEAPL